MKKIISLILLLASMQIKAQPFQFNNGDFSSGGTPYMGAGPGACISMNGVMNWNFNSGNGFKPQLTSFQNGTNPYIDLTPCGTTGNGAWIEQTIGFGDRIQCDSMYISFDLRPMGSGSQSNDAGVMVSMDGNNIGSRVFSADASQWVNKYTASFKVTPGSHVFRFTGQSNGAGNNTPAVMGLDNIQLHALAKPGFKVIVNGIAKDIPADGSAIEVPCDNVIIDPSITTPCAKKYEVHVQECDKNWNRTYDYEWGSWFTGPVPNSINIQQLATTIERGANYTGTDRNREGQKLIAGNLQNGQERYYRIAVCTGEPSWDCKFALIKIIPGPALDKSYSRFSIETSVPDAAGNYTITAKAIALPAECSFYWEINEMDANGNVIPGTKMANPAAWWTNPLLTSFPGYGNGATAGKFNISKRYRITRGTWCQCKAWDQSSVMVQYNNEKKILLNIPEELEN